MSENEKKTDKRAYNGANLKLTGGFEMPVLPLEKPSFDIGAFIMTIRRQMAVPRKQLSRCTGIALTQIARIELGIIKKPAYVDVERLLYALGVRIAFSIAVAGYEHDGVFEKLMLRGESVSEKWYKDVIASIGDEEKEDEVLRNIKEQERLGREMSERIRSRRKQEQEQVSEQIGFGSDLVDSSLGNYKPKVKGCGRGKKREETESENENKWTGGGFGW